MPAPLLRVRGLHVEARVRRAGRTPVWRPIVNGVDLTVDRGQVLGLIGETGAGKSTLGLAAMGYARRGCRLSKGEIRFDGVELRTAAPAVLHDMRGHKVAYVAQSAAAAFNPAHRILAQILEVARIHGSADRGRAQEHAVELFERMALPDPRTFGERYPHEVSGGQKQRVCIARALAAEPDLVICDEVTSALDPLVADGILELLMRLQREVGVSFVFITHDMAMVRAIADGITVLRDGQVMEAGARDEVFATPRSDYTVRLIESTPEMETGWLDRALESRARRNDRAQASLPRR